MTAPEALLFTDDLTMPAGRDPEPDRHAAAPARPGAGRLSAPRRERRSAAFTGTGFRIGSDLVLTNHHVLFPEKVKATTVQVDFGFDVDANGASLPVVSLAGDPSTIVGDQTDDWAVDPRREH